MRKFGSISSLSALAAGAALALVAAVPGVAFAKPKEGDVYHYFGRGGECLEDTWESSDEGAGFEPAGGWGPCPIARPHDRPHVVKKPRDASPN